MAAVAAAVRGLATAGRPWLTHRATALLPSAALACARARSSGGGEGSGRDAVPLPEQARVVVVGGGIIGTSVAYHLGKLGWGGETLLLERDRITSGTTWHAAGLMVTFGSLSETSTDLRKYSKHLYSTLEAETGQSTGFKPIGFIELASDKDYLEEYRRVSAFNRNCGIDVQEIGPEEVQRRFPLCDVDDVVAGFLVEDDGRVNPVDATAALAKGARMGGCRIVEGVSVAEVLRDGGRVTGVRTSDGRTVACEYVVNCAGMWARQLAEGAGVVVPNQAAEHYYVITGAMPEVDPSWPVVEDPKRHAYIRPEAGGLMVGLFEPKAAAWNVRRIPSDFSFGEIEPDWERMGPFVETAMSRVPASVGAGVKKFFCGPESFTPDLNPVVGEAPGLRNYFVAAGMNSIGILTGGGIGRLVASWVVNGEPDADVTAMTPARFSEYQLTPAYRRERVQESLGKVYFCHYPSMDAKSARGVRRTPLYARLAERGACFRDVSGWEGADWYADGGAARKTGGAAATPTAEPLTWGRHHWFDRWAAEHRACREGVVLIDMSFMSKFAVEGPDASRILNRLSTANVDPGGDGDGDGVITYTQWLAPSGKVRADLTVTRLGPERFMVVASDNTRGEVLAWMRRHAEDLGADRLHIADVTGAFAQINVQGPRSRELLQSVTSVDMSDEAFPFRAVKKIDVGYCHATCARITYVGELGYELFVPTEYAVHAHEVLCDAGEEFGLAHAGLKALGSLRMEKGYRDFGHDVDNTDTVLEVGLGFTCDFDKAEGFLGRDAVLAQKAEGPLKKRLLQVLLDDPEPLMYHGEVVLRDGEVVGDVRAASYGHTLGGAVGLALVEADVPINRDYINGGTWDVDVAGTHYPARVSIRPMYDPANARIRC